jgi:hypothetical protein
MPGATGVAAFFELLQKAKTAQKGKTTIIFFILTIIFIPQKPQPCQKTILSIFVLKKFEL